MKRKFLCTLLKAHLIWFSSLICYHLFCWALYSSNTESSVVPRRSYLYLSTISSCLLPSHFQIVTYQSHFRTLILAPILIFLQILPFSIPQPLTELTTPSSLQFIKLIHISVTEHITLHIQRYIWLHFFSALVDHMLLKPKDCISVICECTVLSISLSMVWILNICSTELTWILL